MTFFRLPKYTKWSTIDNGTDFHLKYGLGDLGLGDFNIVCFVYLWLTLTVSFLPGIGVDRFDNWRVGLSITWIESGFEDRAYSRRKLHIFKLQPLISGPFEYASLCVLTQRHLALADKLVQKFKNVDYLKSPQYKYNFKGLLYFN